MWMGGYGIFLLELMLCCTVGVVYLVWLYSSVRYYNDCVKKEKKCGHCNELLPVYKRHKQICGQHLLNHHLLSNLMMRLNALQACKDLTALKNHRILLQCLTMMRLFHMMN